MRGAGDFQLGLKLMIPTTNSNKAERELINSENVVKYYEKVELCSLAQTILMFLIALLFTALWHQQSANSRVEAKCTTSKKPFAITLDNCTLPGTNVDSWGISSIEIGGTTTCLTPSMFVDNTLLMDIALCGDGHRDDGENTRAQCESRRGGPVNTTALGSEFTRGKESDLAVDQNWKNLMERANVLENVYGTPGRVNLLLPNDMRLPQFSVGVINEGQDHNTAHLGLGPNSTFLRALGAQGMGPALGFGLNVGSQSISAPRTGNLVIDGFDSASVRGAWHNYSINHNTPDPGSRICPLQVVVEELTIKFANGTQSTSLLGRSTSRSTPVACIEPYDNYFRFPTPVFDAFSAAINSAEQDVRYSEKLYIVEPGLLYRTLAFTGSLIIKLEDGLVVEIPREEMSRPLRGIDASGTRVLQDNITEVAVFHVADVLGKMALGKAFLSQVYLQVDYKADKFRLASLDKTSKTPNPVSFGSNSTIECQEEGSMDAKNIGFTVAFSIVAAILLALAILWYLWQRKQPRRPVQEDGARDSDPELVPNRPGTENAYNLGVIRQTASGTSELSAGRSVREIGGR